MSVTAVDIYDARGEKVPASQVHCVEVYAGEIVPADTTILVSMTHGNPICTSLDADTRIIDCHVNAGRLSLRVECVNRQDELFENFRLRTEKLHQLLHSAMTECPPLGPQHNNAVQNTVMSNELRKSDEYGALKSSGGINVNPNRELYSPPPSPVLRTHSPPQRLHNQSPFRVVSPPPTRSAQPQSDEKDLPARRLDFNNDEQRVLMPNVKRAISVEKLQQSSTDATK